MSVSPQYPGIRCGNARPNPLDLVLISDNIDFMESSLKDVLEKAVELQVVVPGAVLVGGTRLFVGLVSVACRPDAASSLQSLALIPKVINSVLRIRAT